MRKKKLKKKILLKDFICVKREEIEIKKGGRGVIEG